MIILCLLFSYDINLVDVVCEVLHRLKDDLKKNKQVHLISECMTLLHIYSSLPFVYLFSLRVNLPLLLYVHCVVNMVPFCIGIYVYDIPLQCRELFLSNSGVEQLVSLTQPVNKVIVAMVTDIFLQLSVESGEGDLIVCNRQS